MGGLQNNDLDQFLRERLASAHAALENIDEARFMADPAVTATLTQLTISADRINTATRRWHIELRAHVDAAARQRHAGRDSRQEFLEHLRRQHL